MDYLKNYNNWLNNDYIDQNTKAELRAIGDNDTEIKERFHKNLEFGTGGLRGIIGAGTNRMNIYTVRKATQGLANYILNQDFGGKCPKEMGVVIAHDSRNMSPEFSKEAALVLNGNGIKTYVFDSLRSTPELSFAVRHLGCAAGIVITASHNPPEYNGYKVYGEDGAQVPFPKDEEIIGEVNKIEEFTQIKVACEAEAGKEGLFNVLDEKQDDAYIEAVLNQRVNPEAVKEAADRLTLVYTPLHGTGYRPVKRILEESGFKNIHIVKEQAEPDGNFTTVGYPNPEDPKAFALAIKLAEEVGADVIVGTDPDADRVGAVVKDAGGQYVILNGNMTGVLMTDYIITQKKEKGVLPENAAVISTIVSTNMTKKIAEVNGIDYYNVLTGFKFIGQKIRGFEANGSNEYIFGFEESYGSLPGTYARDKDAVAATMLLCEIAAYYKLKGMTLYDGLMSLYEKYGYYKEDIRSITLKGIEGSEKIKAIMNTLRENPPKVINGLKVIKASDYSTSKEKDLLSGEEKEIDMVKSNVLYYDLEGDSWICARPSGTEPKLKIYFGSKGNSLTEVENNLEGIIADTMAMVEKI